MIKNVFFGVILDILIQYKHIHKELHKNIKNLLMILIMMELNFLWQKNISKTEEKNNKSANVFCYENKLTFPIYIYDQTFENSMDLLLIIKENKSHYVYIRDFYRFMFQKTKNKNKKNFCESCFQRFG